MAPQAPLLLESWLRVVVCGAAGATSAEEFVRQSLELKFVRRSLQDKVCKTKFVRRSLELKFVRQSLQDKVCEDEV